ncbi:hypothetical protein K439DRAFT_1615924 [Ramaria rubella]|nr:hypothetical protein K439DRAFT_1615924 [Ramaria rubella]
MYGASGVWGPRVSTAGVVWSTPPGCGDGVKGGRGKSVVPTYVPPAWHLSVVVVGRRSGAIHARMAPFACALPLGCADVAVRNGTAYTQSKKYWGPFESPLVCMRHPGGCGWVVAVWMWMWEREHAGVTFHVMDSDVAPDLVVKVTRMVL